MIPNAETRFRATDGAKPRPRNRAGSIIGESTVRWRRTNKAAKSSPTVIETT